MNHKMKPACCSVSRSLSAEKSTLTFSEGNEGSKENMIKIPGGNFLMGTNDLDGFSADGEGPVREITIDSFYIDTTTVTNLQFEEFIKDTGYQTDAEHFGWSFVFYGLLSDEVRKSHLQVASTTPWWCAIPGACWNHPEGVKTQISRRMDHPVVHVSWNDSMAYCQWAGKRLPTEAEWEYSARGGLVQKKFPWGDELNPGGEHRCNIWQGVFPNYNSLEDGYLGTSPALSFKANDYGLYNMAGNVWEWCNNWFSNNFHLADTSNNPKGPEQGETKVIRGGSFLCHHTYCNRYRVAARSSNTIDSTASNIGFRCAVDE